MFYMICGRVLFLGTHVAMCLEKPDLCHVVLLIGDLMLLIHLKEMSKKEA